MKKYLIFLLLSSPIYLSAQFFDKLKKQVEEKVGLESGKLTSDEAVKGIKEALSKGTEETVDLVSDLNGYYKNPEIKIPFPEDAKKVESTLRKAGLGSQVDDAVESMNRAAEDAAVEAKKIFIDAIKNMTVKDALDIVGGNKDAATMYLKSNTSQSLSEKFRPIIENSLKKVDATKYWETVTKSYNKIPFTKKVETDLTEYVTARALEGLFIMIAKEELKIRENPAARTSEILKKVFG